MLDQAEVVASRVVDVGTARVCRTEVG
jgi:hypothetical protein